MCADKIIRNSRRKWFWKEALPHRLLRLSLCLECYKRTTKVIEVSFGFLLVLRQHGHEKVWIPRKKEKFVSDLQGDPPPQSLIHLCRFAWINKLLLLLLKGIILRSSKWPPFLKNFFTDLFTNNLIINDAVLWLPNFEIVISKKVVCWNAEQIKNVSLR